jgi:hypothetical protein
MDSEIVEQISSESLEESEVKAYGYKKRQNA